MIFSSYTVNLSKSFPMICTNGALNIFRQPTDSCEELDKLE